MLDSNSNDKGGAGHVQSQSLPVSQPCPGKKRFSLSLGYPTVTEAQRAFDALAEGGQVTMPLQKTFWAEVFGMAGRPLRHTPGWSTAKWRVPRFQVASLRESMMVVADDSRDLPLSIFILPDLNKLPLADRLYVVPPRMMEAVGTDLDRTIAP